MDILDFLQEIRKIKIDGQWYLKEATAKTGKVLKKLASQKHGLESKQLRHTAGHGAQPDNHLATWDGSQTLPEGVPLLCPAGVACIPKEYGSHAGADRRSEIPLGGAGG